jgi:hypothetical protein
MVKTLVMRTGRRYKVGIKVSPTKTDGSTLCRQDKDRWTLTNVSLGTVIAQYRDGYWMDGPRFDSLDRQDLYPKTSRPTVVPT